MPVYAPDTFPCQTDIIYYLPLYQLTQNPRYINISDIVVYYNKKCLRSTINAG